jgi:nucleoside-diphosphate-sugar epimerase
VRAFLTGATGFVGSHVAEALLSRADSVVCLARNPDRAAALTARGAEVVRGTLDDPAVLERAAAGADVVYHVAGLTAGTETELIAVNRDGTRRMIEAVRRAAPGSRLVYVSSQAVLGPSTPGGRLAEDAPTHPLTAYGRTKLAGEMAVRETPDLSWVVVRPSPVYGPWDREFLRLFRIVRWRLAPVFGNGTQQLSLVFAPDLAQAIVLAGTQTAALGQVFHAAHREVVTSAEVARAVGRAMGVRPVVLPVPGALAAPIVRAIGRAAAAAGQHTVVNADKLAEFLAPAWVLAVDKAEQRLGWRAAHNLESGMAKTAAWYREAGWL